MPRTVAQVASAAVAGAAIGAAGGAAIGAGLTDGGWVAGLVAGGVIFALMSAWNDANRTPAAPQPLLGRVLASGLLMAVFGSLLQAILPEWHAALPAAVTGALLGSLGLRPGKVALGAAAGAGLGVAFEAIAPGIGWSVVLAATAVVYRLTAAVIWRNREQIAIRAEKVRPEHAPYVVPFAERTRYVGVDYLMRYAETVGAHFLRNPLDIGIIATLDDLVGPTFDPGVVHPLVREFYEHTSRFHLRIVPEWKRWMRLPYLAYRELVAKPLGQANAPFNQTEVQDGVVSWIDTIDVDRDGTIDFRAWVRAYRGGTEPLYVGVYTVQRVDGVGYVSVGFPLPAGSFTATLVPRNRGDGLLLASDGDGDVSGHYLSVIEESGDLTVLELRSFGEEIEVLVAEGRLTAEQRFSLGGAVFMILHYSMERAEPVD
jgi:hypothetical protein